MNSETIQNHYNNLINLGISHHKIALSLDLLGRKQETIQSNFDNLINLGITLQKIVKIPQLLGRNPETIQNHYDNLRRLGILPQKIASRAELLGNAPDTVSRNYRYLTNILHLEENIVQNLPQILTENPDAFAKKMRILKLEILGFKRNDNFDFNNYVKFFITSPATLMAKKEYYIENGIDYRNNLANLLIPWRKVIKKVDSTIDITLADNEGRRRTKSFKQGYDNWMKEYKKWAKEFASRRGRRLIIRI